MKQGAHYYYGDRIGRAFRFISKLGPLPKIRPKVWAEVFGEMPTESVFKVRRRRRKPAGACPSNCPTPQPITLTFP